MSQEKFGVDDLAPEIKRFVEKSIIDGKRYGELTFLTHFRQT